MQCPFDDVIQAPSLRSQGLQAASRQPNLHEKSAMPVETADYRVLLVSPLMTVWAIRFLDSTATMRMFRRSI